MTRTREHRADASVQDQRALDRIARLTAFAIAVTAVLVGVSVGSAEMDVDQKVYHDTLGLMRTGDGFYEAHRDALIDKEGAPPTSVRAVRPPTLFLVLRWFPEGSWRWLAGIPFLGILLAALALGRPYGRYGGLLAVVLAGLWVLAAAPFLYLHSEVWGAGLLLWGAVAVRRDSDAGGAALIAGATLLRELFAPALLIGAIMARRRIPWLISGGVVVALAGLHVMLAQDVLSPEGTQAALGNEPLSIARVLTILGPGDSVLSWAVGLLLLTTGIAAMARHRRQDRAAALLLPFCALMIPASVLATRAYWALTWGPAVASFVPAVVRGRTVR